MKTRLKKLTSMILIFTMLLVAFPINLEAANEPLTIDINEIQDTQAKLTVNYVGNTFTYPVGAYKVLKKNETAPNVPADFNEFMSSGWTMTNEDEPLTVTGNTQSKVIEDLESGQDYVVYALLTEAPTGEFSGIVSKEFTTTNTGSVDPLTIDINEIQDTQAKLTVNYVGNTFTYPVGAYKVLKKNETAPNVPANFNEFMSSGWTMTNEDEPLTVTGNKQSKVIEDLESGQDYVVYALLTEASTGEFSGIVSKEFTTTNTGSVYPLTIDINEIKDNQAKLTVNYVGGSTFTNPMGAYKVLEKTAQAPNAPTDFNDFMSSGWQVTNEDYDPLTATGNTQSKVMEDLEAGTEYVVYVLLAEAGVQDPSFSEIVSKEFTTTNTGSVDPLTVDINEIKDTQAKLTVNYVGGSTFTNPVAGYKVLEKTAQAPNAPTDFNDFMSSGWQVTNEDYDPLTATGNTQSKVMEDLEAGTEYVVYVLLAEAGVQDPNFSEIVSKEFTTTNTGSGTVNPTEAVIELTYNKNGQKNTETFASPDLACVKMNSLATDCTNIELKVLKDITKENTEKGYALFNIKKTCSLDLNGHSIKFESNTTNSSEGVCIYVNRNSNDVEFTIKDTSVSESGKIIQNSGNGSLIQVGDFKLTGDVDINYNNKASLIIESGNIVATVPSGVHDDYVIYTGKNTELNIKGGKIQGCVVACNSFIMEDGLIESRTPGSILEIRPSKDGIVKITGGTIHNSYKGTADDIKVTSAIQVTPLPSEASHINLIGNEDVNITGGKFYSDWGQAIYIDEGTRSHKCKIKINVSGDTQLVSKNGASVGFSADFIYNDNDDPEKYFREINIKSGVKLEGKEIFRINPVYEIFNLKPFKINSINIEDGVLMKYDENNQAFYPNSAFVNFADAKVLDIKPIQSGANQGYYVLKNKTELTQTVGNQQVGYQRYEPLITALQIAKPIIEAGNPGADTDLWNNFVNAYKYAGMVYDIDDNKGIANANQVEIDYFASELSKTGRKVAEDVENSANIDVLADGTYYVDIEMRQAADINQLSMASTAVTKKAKLIVKDGKAKLEMTFKPISQMGKLGSLMKLWRFKGDTFLEAQNNATFNYEDDNARVEATYPKWHTVNMTNGTISPIAVQPSEEATIYNDIRPEVAIIDVPYIGTKDGKNQILCYVAVDMMRMIGVGDQPVVVIVKYSTLEPIDVKATLTVNREEISLIKELANNDKQKINAKVVGGIGYSITYDSDNENIATVDSNGMVSAVSEGVCTINIKAEKNGEDTLTKTVSVKVSDSDKDKVDVTNIETSDGKTKATISGDTLVSTGSITDNVIDNSGTVIINAKHSASTSRSEEVTIKNSAANALKDKKVSLKTNFATLVLNKDVMKKIAGVNGDVVLSVAKVEQNKIGNNSFQLAYEFSLKEKTTGNDITFDNSKIVVKVKHDSTLLYAYYIEDNKIKEKVGVLSDNSGTYQFDIKHFSRWALAVREYTIDNNSGAGDNNNSNTTQASLDYKNLKDGIYKVDLDVRHAYQNGELSMADASVVRPANIVVEDGRYYLQLTFQPIEKDWGAGTFKGYLGSMKYKTPSGSFEDVSVLEYYEGKDDFYSILTDKYGSGAKYPKVIKYEIEKPDSKIQETTAQVFVPVMESIMPGGGTKTCKPTIYWDELSEGEGSHNTSSHNPSNSGGAGASGEEKIEEEKVPEGKLEKNFPFKDVKSDDWFMDSVKYVYEQGIMMGTSKDMFSPQLNVNRGMMVTILHRIEKEPASNAEAMFEDVEEGKWYHKAVNWAYNNKIVKGYSDKEFGPENNMTREELVTMIYRFEEAPKVNVNINEYSDANQVSKWSLNAMKWAKQEGLIKGNPDGTLNPKGTATRAELSAIIERYSSKKTK